LIQERRIKGNWESRTSIVAFILEHDAHDLVLDESRGMIRIVRLQVEVIVERSGLDGKHEIACPGQPLTKERHTRQNILRNRNLTPFLHIHISDDPSPHL
jgi:hypothetical protein